jgi:predicted nucleic acid-binding Zn ribbon protein
MNIEPKHCEVCGKARLLSNNKCGECLEKLRNET